MRIEDRIRDEYFEWLCDLVNRDGVSYRKLLSLLHNTEFRYSIKLDSNRYNDGVNLRYKYSCDIHDRHVTDYLNDPCSVLEMMIALAIKCERDITGDTHYGDRSSQWFWNMIVSLGLGGMYDDVFNKRKANDILTRFLDREYEPNGKGGLFTIRNCDVDVRDIEIWHQMCWYLDSIT